MWNRKHHRLTRQELHNLVWSEPGYKVAARYGISVPGLAKICRKFDISLPERGYWNRVQAGKLASCKQLKKSPRSQMDQAATGSSLVSVATMGIVFAFDSATSLETLNGPLSGLII